MMCPDSSWLVGQDLNVKFRRTETRSKRALRFIVRYDFFPSAGTHLVFEACPFSTAAAIPISQYLTLCSQPCFKVPFLSLSPPFFLIYSRPRSSDNALYHHTSSFPVNVHWRFCPHRHLRLVGKSLFPSIVIRVKFDCSFNHGRRIHCSANFSSIRQLTYFRSGAMTERMRA